jgi:hypothetical protein
LAEQSGSVAGRRRGFDPILGSTHTRRRSSLEAR